MKNIYLKISLVLFFIGTGSGLFSQNIGINTTGTTPSVNAILDLNTGNSNNLGLIIPNVTLGALLTTFNPPMANAATVADKGMMVYNSGGIQPVGYYYWNGATWVDVAGVGGPVSADNGLSVGSFTAGNVELGGTIATPSPLKGNSVISGSNFNLDFDLGTYSVAGTGSFLVTNGGLGTPLLSVTSNTPGVGVNVNPAVSTLDVNGSYGVGTIDMAPASGSTTALTGAYSTIIATPPALGNTYTLTLPSATANPRRIYTIVYNGGTLGTIDITSPVAGNILLNAVATTPLPITDAATITFQSDGANWIVTQGQTSLGAQAIVVQTTGQIVNPACCTQTLLPGLSTTITLPVSEYVVISMAVGVGNNSGLANNYTNAVFFVNIGINSYFICSGGANNSSSLGGCYQTVAGNYGVKLAPGTYTITIGGYDLNGNCFIGGPTGNALQGTMVVYAFPP